eukprot:CAMPEP_0174259848 /NCGR_PEP_ID=MMETSP0439-20130205/8626_1 /TAXON_ID=0 /ORGANISM="Stereomyxa ramosa, Strain Chinc5" /LENGTH=2151 /DNA_ID=CAMNT_0015343913 /DNA_START=9 /DNA_END=6464 /DNA_ORIENTATION=-
MADALEVPWQEDFALYPDKRDSTLKTLLPASPDFYFYNLIHKLNNVGEEGLDEKTRELLKQAESQDRGRYPQMAFRALLKDVESEKDAKKQKDLIKKIQQTIGVSFYDPPPDVVADDSVSDSQSSHPSELSLPSHDSWQKVLLRRLSEINELTQIFGNESTYDLVVPMVEGLSDEFRFKFLQTLAREGRSDIAHFMKLLAEQYEYETTEKKPTFVLSEDNYNSLLSSMTLKQLLEVESALPEVTEKNSFVTAKLNKLLRFHFSDLSSVDKKSDDWGACLKSLYDFCSQLPPVRNQTKFQVLYNLLTWYQVRDEQGSEEAQKYFLEYVKLPRKDSSRAWKMQHPQTSFVDYSCHVQDLVSPGGDEDENIIQHFLNAAFTQDPDEVSLAPFSDYLPKDVLTQYLISSKLLSGQGDSEFWCSKFPEFAKAFKDVISIEFSDSNQLTLKCEDEVTLDVELKNVPTLIIKVFEINTDVFYRQNKSEIDMSINLDGLVASEEVVHEYDMSSFIMHKEHFSFPSLTNKRGVFVIDFIGNGISSRALLRKGYFNVINNSTVYGHEISVYDENNQLLKEDVKIWMAGITYQPDETGLVVIPYTSSPKTETLLISHDGFTFLDSFYHQSEDYTFFSGFYLDQETLLPSCETSLLVHPQLFVNNSVASLHRVDNAELTVSYSDFLGGNSSKTFDITKKVQTADLTDVSVSFVVPPNCSNISCSLTVKVKLQSQEDTTKTLTSSTFYPVNGILQTKQISDHFVQPMLHNGCYRLFVLGRAGEPIPRQTLKVTVHHRLLNLSKEFTVQSDENGCITLKGDEKTFLLAGRVEWSGKVWNVPNTSYLDIHYPNTINCKATDTLQIPLPDYSKFSDISLPDISDLISFVSVDRHHNQIVDDKSDLVSIGDRAISLSNLEAGSYQLTLKCPTHSLAKITVHVAPASAVPSVKGSHLLHGSNKMELKGQFQEMPTIGSVVAGKEGLEINVLNHTPQARVHVVCSQFYPSLKLADNLRKTLPQSPNWTLTRPRTTRFATGRQLGDEQRYIIDRKYVKKYAGCMLDPPTLQVHPWIKQEVGLSQGFAQQGDEFGRSMDQSACSPSMSAQSRLDSVTQSHTPCYDFLSYPSSLFFNLEVGDGGVVVIPADQFAPGGKWLQIAIVDQEFVVGAEMGLPKELQQDPEGKIETRDLVLDETKALDPDSHYIEEQNVSVVEPGALLNTEDSTKVELFSSLDKVFDFYSGLTSGLKKFSFLSDWIALSEEEKRKKHKEFASHELNFFLYQKDREFFDAVVRPELEIKTEKTFMDYFLLQDMEFLHQFTSFQLYKTLNLFERLLLASCFFQLENFLKVLDDKIKAISPVDQQRIKKTRFLLACGMSALDVTPRLALKKEKMKAFAGRMRRRQNSCAMRFDSCDFSLARSASFRMEKKDRKSGGFFGPVQKTKEWEERAYYERSFQNDAGAADLVSNCEFWADYARYLLDSASLKGKEKDSSESGFLSTNFYIVGSGFTELCLALAVLDLPFPSQIPSEEKPVLEYNTSGAVKSVKVGSLFPLVAFHSDLRVVGSEDDLATEDGILIAQCVFDPENMFTYENGERIERFLPDSYEFMKNQPYTCRVVVTNVTSSPKSLDLLTQIPRGSLPLEIPKQTDSKTIHVQPYDTHQHQFTFYFPFEGNFQHYPAHLSKDGKPVAWGEKKAFNVVETPSVVDRSWKYIARYGNEEEVLQEIENNRSEIEIGHVFHRLHDRSFYDRLIAFFRSRFEFVSGVWKYSFEHNDFTGIREYLQQDGTTLSKIGTNWFRSELLTIEPRKQHFFVHREYSPLIEERVHQFGARRKILNDGLRKQYTAFLDYLCYKSTLSTEDKLEACYYLLLMSRDHEAIQMFHSIQPNQEYNPVSQVFVDYFGAYLALKQGEIEKAEKIAEQYLDHAVERIRERFKAMHKQVKEIKDVGDLFSNQAKESNTSQPSALLAASFEFDVYGSEICVDLLNVTEAMTVNYHVMDIELLFSTSPFSVSKGTDTSRFSFIKPTFSQTFELSDDIVKSGDAGAATLTIPIPEQFSGANLIIELVCHGIRKSSAFFSNSMIVHVLEQNGQLQVSSPEGKPLSKVYVKVYSRRNKRDDGEFYKDGYTDVRGVFDFVSLNSDKLKSVDSFSLLLMSEDYGSIIREANPPKL